MEFPNLGQHCSFSSCNKLDFLPMRCDACSEVFCSDHIHYGPHNCSSSYKKDVQVPVCPLCNRPVPVKKGDLPDVVVGAHIDRDCQSDPAKAKRIYNNRCKASGCKKRELVPIICSSCRLNFCLKHRHADDHQCQGFQETSRAVSNAGFAAWFRSMSSSKPDSKAEKQSQPSAMDEDEALARALQESLNPSAQAPKQRSGNPGNSQETEDEALAKALQQSEEEYLRHQQRSRSEKQCILA